jgi:hypothetical protein
VGEDDPRPVEPELKPRRRDQRRPEHGAAMLVRGIEPGDDAVSVHLLDLVAVVGIVQEEREVREQVELVVLEVRVDLRGARVRDEPAQVAVRVESLRAAALAVVDRAEAVDEPEADRALGDLARAEPVAVEVRDPRGDVDVLAERGRRLAEDVESDVVLRAVEGPVGRVHLHGE